MKSLRFVRVALVSGVAMAVVIGASIAQAQSDPAAGTSNPGVSIAGFAFAPADTTIPLGTTLTWTNAQDGVQHTTTSLDGIWDSGVLATTDSFSFTFVQSGDFAYQCAIHPSMRGVVHVLAQSSAQSAAAPAAAATPVPTVEQVPPTSSSTAPATVLPTTVPTAPATALPTFAPTPRVVATRAATPTTGAYYGY